MNKAEFLNKLRAGLSGLPVEEREEQLVFYAEMIDDRVEEGVSEEDAVAAIGDVDAIVTQIISDIPLSKLVKKRINPKRKIGALQIVLIILGSPILFSVLVVAFVLILSVYVVIWSVIASLWSVFAALIASALGGLVGGVMFMVQGYGASGLATVGAAISLAGLSILMFFPCRYATKGASFLSRKIVVLIKRLFVKKEDEE